jgi:hypothetical protein
MKVVFTIGLENGRALDADLLQAFVSDAVQSFATRTSARAGVERVRLYADEFDPLNEYPDNTHKARTHRRIGNYTRPGRSS